MGSAGMMPTHPDRAEEASGTNHMRRSLSCPGDPGTTRVPPVIDSKKLRSQTAKELAAMAKKKGISGWHSMRKEELISALVELTKSKTAARKASGKQTSGRTANGSASTPTPTRTRKAAPQNKRVVAAIRDEAKRREQMKDLARVTSRTSRAEPERDRVVLIVRDPYWIQAYWEITRSTVDRARVALAANWHEAKPVIRVFEVSEHDRAHSGEQAVRDIPVHGGVRNWYIDVPEPPKTYRIGIGYALPGGKFHLIAKSNKVTTPIPNASETVDHNWTDIAMNHQKFYALSGGYSDDNSDDELRNVFEEKLRRPMVAPMFTQVASSALGGDRGFEFGVDAELVMYGTADPEASVTLAGEPVKLRADGTFEVRMPLPDRRQVLPVVACSRDGTEQRTTVIAIERNTKVMEPISRDMDEVND